MGTETVSAIKIIIATTILSYGAALVECSDACDVLDCRDRWCILSAVNTPFIKSLLSLLLLFHYCHFTLSFTRGAGVIYEPESFSKGECIYFICAFFYYTYM